MEEEEIWNFVRGTVYMTLKHVNETNSNLRNCKRAVIRVYNNSILHGLINSGGLIPCVFLAVGTGILKIVRK